MGEISQGIKRAKSVAQLERMLNTLSWNLFCDKCKRDTRHWYRGPAKEDKIIIYCAGCDTERRSRLTELVESPDEL